MNTPLANTSLAAAALNIAGNPSMNRNKAPVGIPTEMGYGNPKSDNPQGYLTATQAAITNEQNLRTAMPQTVAKFDGEEKAQQAALNTDEQRYGRMETAFRNSKIEALIPPNGYVAAMGSMSGGEEAAMLDLIRSLSPGTNTGNLG
tara:strand:+ start:106 stop:543 length:438 start_codon:yes stop_codon:yes gene_type:complete